MLEYGNLYILGQHRTDVQNVRDILAKHITFELKAFRINERDIRGIERAFGDTTVLDFQWPFKTSWCLHAIGVVGKKGMILDLANNAIEEAKPLGRCAPYFFEMLSGAKAIDERLKMRGLVRAKAVKVKKKDGSPSIGIPKTIMSPMSKRELMNKLGSRPRSHIVPSGKVNSEVDRQFKREKRASKSN